METDSSFNAQLNDMLESKHIGRLLATLVYAPEHFNQVDPVLKGFLSPLCIVFSSSLDLMIQFEC